MSRATHARRNGAAVPAAPEFFLNEETNECVMRSFMRRGVHVTLLLREDIFVFRCTALPTESGPVAAIILVPPREVQVPPVRPPL